MRTITGSKIATSVALSFKITQVNSIGHLSHKSRKDKQQKGNKDTYTYPKPKKQQLFFYLFQLQNLNVAASEGTS